jgi:hypothetical protein
MEGQTPAMQLSTPALQQLYSDWTRWRGERKFPARGDLDPTQLKYTLGNLWVFDVFYNPLRFNVRIHASARAERMGFDLTGKSLDALPDAKYRELIRAHLIEVLKARAPVSKVVEPTTLAKSFGRVEVLVLPFSSDGQTIDFLAAGSYLLLPARLSPQPQAQRERA